MTEPINVYDIQTGYCLTYKGIETAKEAVWIVSNQYPNGIEGTGGNFNTWNYRYNPDECDVEVTSNGYRCGRWWAKSPFSTS